MGASGHIAQLMRLSFAEISGLPESSSQDVVDDSGKKYQLVTWHEQLGPDVHRVVVSQHKLHGLGINSLRAAYGFTISAGGKIELLDPTEAEQLLL